MFLLYDTDTKLVNGFKILKIVVEPDDKLSYQLSIDETNTLWVDELTLAGLLDKKAVLPGYVAAWLDKAKALDLTLLDAMTIKDLLPLEIENWLLDYGMRHTELFSRAWLDGYEVEK